MASSDERFGGNAPGPYYNDTTCIDCGLCPDIAPMLFRRDDVHGQAYVWRQPETETERTLAEEARSACPTESIGADGAA